MSKQLSKEDLKNMHCKSSCIHLEEKNQMRQKCKNACLCNTNSIEHKNSLKKAECVPSAVPQSHMPEYMQHFSSFKSTQPTSAPAPVKIQAPVVANEPKAPIVANEPKAPVVANKTESASN